MTARDTPQPPPAPGYDRYETPQWQPPSPPPPAAERGVARWLVPVAVGFVALFVGIGVGAASGGAPSVEQTPAAAKPAVVAATVTATVTAPAAAPAAAAAPATTAAVAAPAATTPPAAPPAAAAISFAMPDETGKILQAAQDHVQAVSGNPLFVTTSSDATGQGRMQVLDSNWSVCSQSVPVGATVTDAVLIDFSVVKLGESCP